MAFDYPEIAQLGFGFAPLPANVGIYEASAEAASFLPSGEAPNAHKPTCDCSEGSPFEACRNGAGIAFRPRAGVVASSLGPYHLGTPGLEQKVSNR